MLHITVNGRPQDTELRTVGELRAQSAPESDAALADGYGVEDSRPLREGMALFFWQYGRPPSAGQLDALLTARDTPAVRDRLRQARVGIAGLGGLGSVLAVMLARTGVGTLVLADYDRVDPTNLNRQDYTVADIGRLKTEALRDRLRQAAPGTRTELFSDRITADNAAAVFGSCPVVCEAFDRAEEKALLTETLLAECPALTLVSGNGLAGYGHADEIRTVRRLPRLIVCGDGSSAAAEGQGLMAPRAGICAGHMADAVLEIIMQNRDETDGQ